MAGKVAGRRIGSLPSFLHDCRGAVAVETALVSIFLVFLIAQVLDFGWYVYCSTQVKMAAQAAAAEAAVTCNTAALLPATQNCGSNLSTNMTNAAQQVGLGNQISITSTNEGYFCTDPNANNALVAKGSLASKPADCTPYSATEAPADFVYVTTSYNFSPMFPGVSAISFFTGPITATAWMRVG